jgi:carboxypeptidase Taq
MAPPAMNDPYPELERRFKRISALREAGGMLQWDTAVLMPKGGAGVRGEQLAALQLTCHELLVDPRILELLDRAESESTLDDWQRANLREMRRAWIHASALDGPLVEALTRARLACEMTWREARPENDFARVVPKLEELLARVRDTADAKAVRLGVPPYQALLDEYEPGFSTARIDALFEELAQILPGILARVLTRQKSAPPPAVPEGPFPVEAQRALCERLMRQLGFDFESGRLDVSLHPFCGGVPEDIRITTRFDESDFARSLMGVLHETGHALYEKGLPVAWRHQPVGEARGMALHESQSLLVEMLACRSREFLGFAAPLMREAFGGVGEAWSAGNLHRLAIRVEPGLIRVDADEVTYPAHVILRYRLERDLIARRLAVSDLPQAWNAGMQELLGIVPPDDRNGCMQDIHWYDGAWGYFPTYTLGALAAAQLFEAALSQRADIMIAIGEGNFAPLLGWLRSNVHGKGSLLTTEALIEAATGHPLGTEAFQRHLTRRYLG